MGSVARLVDIEGGPEEAAKAEGPGCRQQGSQSYKGCSVMKQVCLHQADSNGSVLLPQMLAVHEL